MALQDMPTEHRRILAERNWNDYQKANREHELGVGSTLSGGGGGAADHAESQNRHRFSRSPLGLWAQRAGGQKLFDKEFNKKYHGGAVPMKYGQSISPAKWDQYVESIGGNPYSKERYYAKFPQQAPGRQGMIRPQSDGYQPPATAGAGVGAGDYLQQMADAGQGYGQRQQYAPSGDIYEKDDQSGDLFADFLEETERLKDEANAANIERYDEGKGELTTLRDRNMERVANWGEAAQGDLEERMEESLGTNKASLSAKGLGGSSVIPAFAGRNARDTARETQRISEQVDDRSAKYDMQMTGNLVNFIKERNDIPPDYASFAQLAEKFGLGNEGQGFDRLANQKPGQPGQTPQPAPPGVPYTGSSAALKAIMAGGKSRPPAGGKSRPGVPPSSYSALQPGQVTRPTQQQPINTPWGVARKWGKQDLSPIFVGGNQVQQMDQFLGGMQNAGQGRPGIVSNAQTQNPWSTGGERVPDEYGYFYTPRYDHPESRVKEGKRLYKPDRWGGKPGGFV